jgi:DNA-directed RNA polymerase subunit K/omega
MHSLDIPKNNDPKYSGDDDDDDDDDDEEEDDNYEEGDDEEEEEDDEDEDDENEYKGDKKEEEDNLEGDDDDPDRNMNLEEDNDDYDLDHDEDIDEDDDIFQKFMNYSLVENLEKEHPEIRSINIDEMKTLSKVVRDKNGKIIDPLHTTIPFLTKYEKARIIGARAEQLERGAPTALQNELPETVIHGRTIALEEFERKLIPFIIARPLPNKGIEYWKLQDLEII